jgi:hypothetical protein
VSLSLCVLCVVCCVCVSVCVCVCVCVCGANSPKLYSVVSDTVPWNGKCSRALT